MNPKYEVIIYWSQEDQAFIAEVPELPGCAADGNTYREALANAEVVIQEWIETAKALGRRIPSPRGRLVVRVTAGDFRHARDPDRGLHSKTVVRQIGRTTGPETGPCAMLAS